jgi:hypothetical protein
MEALVLKGWLDRDEAIKAGKAEFGSFEVRIGDAIVEALSSDERAWLARSSEGRVLVACRRRSWDSDVLEPLPVPPVRGVDWVLAALRAAYAKFVATEAAYKVSVEEAADYICGQTIDQLLADRDINADGSPAGNTASLASKCARGKAHFEAIQREIEARRHAAHVEKLKKEIDLLLAMPLSKLENVRLCDVSQDVRETESFKARYALALREKEERELAEASRKAKQAEAGKAEFDRYVREHGTASQRARHEAGVLPEKEILERRRNELLPDLLAYVKLTESDVLCDEENHTTVPKFSSSEYSCAMSEQLFDEFQRIKADILEVSPSAEIGLRCHEAWCGAYGCEAGIVLRFSVRASVIWAGHTLTKAYGIDGGVVEIESIRARRKAEGDCLDVELVLSN